MSDALPPGIIGERWVPSRTRDKQYHMYRSRTIGWQHADEGCESWMIRGGCSHVTDLNEETGALAVIPQGEDALAKANELDDKLIVKQLEGQVADTWAYEFKQGGASVRGLSIIGVEQAARQMATMGEALREDRVDCVFENEREARFVARVLRVAVTGNGQEVIMDTAIRAKRQPKYMKLREGGEKFDEHWFEKGISKALRNAKEALISEGVRQKVLDLATKGGRRQPTQRQQRAAPAREPEPIPEQGGHSPAEAEPAEPIDGTAREVPADDADLKALRKEAFEAAKGYAEQHGGNARGKLLTELNALDEEGRWNAGILDADTARAVIEACSTEAAAGGPG